MLMLAFAVALHGHVKRKCHQHGQQSGDFRLLQLHLCRSGEESRHFFRHSLGLMRSGEESRHFFRHSLGLTQHDTAGGARDDLFQSERERELMRENLVRE